MVFIKRGLVSKKEAIEITQDSQYRLPTKKEVSRLPNIVGGLVWTLESSSTRDRILILVKNN